MQLRAVSTRHSFCATVNECETNLAHTFLSLELGPWGPSYEMMLP